MIHIYCGEGKGKTSAAIGLSVRASGRGLPVVFTQFLKGSKTGELEILKTIPTLRILRSEVPVKFSFLMNEEEKAQALKNNNALFDQAVASLQGDNTLLVLDEAVGAMDVGLLDQEKVLHFLRGTKVEVVLTGRNPSEALKSLADYVSEITKIKHPFDKGVPAREGIEF